MKIKRMKEIVEFPNKLNLLIFLPKRARNPDKNIIRTIINNNNSTTSTNL